MRADRRTVGRSDGRLIGVTLIELLIVLVILGLMTTLGLVGVNSLRATDGMARLDTLRSARARAIRTGEAVVVRSDSTRLRFLPDGRVLGGSLDPLTGAWAHEQ